jgi:hypothetical protein
MIDTDTAAFLENYFDKIYVITLERAKERQEHINHNWQVYLMSSFSE